MFVRSKDMIADLGTRRVSDFDVVGKDSVWINGFDLLIVIKGKFQVK